MSNFFIAFFSVFMHNFFTTVPGVPFSWKSPFHDCLQHLRKAAKREEETGNSLPFSMIQ